MLAQTEKKVAEKVEICVTGRGSLELRWRMFEAAYGMATIKTKNMYAQGIEMDYHAELALIKQEFEQLRAMCDPNSASNWRPTESERLAYVQLAEQVLRAMARVRNLERRKLVQEGRYQEYVPDSTLIYIRDNIDPKVSALKETLDRLDPEGALVRQLLDELLGHTLTPSRFVNHTFETGIEQVRDLIDRNPDRDFHWLTPDIACEVIDSPLISFDPDSWLDRANELAPIRTAKKDVLLPSHVRLRIEELNRAYVFGCWLSVLALARAILEYAILDNLRKFNIDPTWPAVGRDQKGKAKKLSDLINDLEPHVPSLTKGMDKLRDYGNDYLHPKKSQVSKESLFQCKSAAKDAMKTVVEVVEGLYLAQ